MSQIDNTSEKTNKYVVVCDAVVVTIGQKQNGKPVYTRVLRGGVLNGTEGSEQIALLVQKGSIKQVKSKAELAEMQADLAKYPYDANDRTQNSRHRQTVRQAAALMGSAPEDMPEPPVEGIAPLPAPMPEVSPDAILASDLSE